MGNGISCEPVCGPRRHGRRAYPDPRRVARPRDGRLRPARGAAARRVLSCGLFFLQEHDHGPDPILSPHAPRPPSSGLRALAPARRRRGRRMRGRRHRRRRRRRRHDRAGAASPGPKGTPASALPLAERGLRCTSPTSGCGSFTRRERRHVPRRLLLLRGRASRARPLSSPAAPYADGRRRAHRRARAAARPRACGAPPPPLPAWTASPPRSAPLLAAAWAADGADGARLRRLLRSRRAGAARGRRAGRFRRRDAPRGPRRDSSTRASASASRAPTPGEPIAPAPFPFDGRVEVSADLASIAARAVREGCINETLAAVQAAEQLARAEDPAVRAALAKIAEDEARHAALAWRTVAWALRAGRRPRARRRGGGVQMGETPEPPPQAFAAPLALPAGDANAEADAHDARRPRPAPRARAAGRARPRARRDSCGPAPRPSSRGRRAAEPPSLRAARSAHDDRDGLAPLAGHVLDRLAVAEGCDCDRRQPFDQGLRLVVVANAAQACRPRRAPATRRTRRDAWAWGACRRGAPRCCRGPCRGAPARRASPSACTGGRPPRRWPWRAPRRARRRRASAPRPRRRGSSSAAPSTPRPAPWSRPSPCSWPWPAPHRASGCRCRAARAPRSTRRSIPGPSTRRRRPCLVSTNLRPCPALTASLILTRGEALISCLLS